jgi:sugar lactone lactonase YvrE/pimeloyl-ACP methyl ester carboxylesterase
MRTRFSFAILAAASLFVMIGCGGGSSSTGPGPTPAPSATPSPTATPSPSPTPTPGPTITAVMVSCATPTVPVSQTNQCSATVQGTGNFDPSIKWAVNGIAGGNGTIGTVDTNGLYAAPDSVPTPFVVNVTATAIADTTKSDSLSVTIAGTVASSSQVISAASGGTITLADGSSVTIPAGVLPADQTVTLSESSVLAHQPPNQMVTGVGVSLEVTLGNPIPPAHAPLRTALQSNLTVQGNITFTLPLPTSTTGVSGAIGLISLTDINGNSIFLDTTVNTGSTPAFVSFTVPSQFLSNLTAAAKSAAISLANNVFQVFPRFIVATTLPANRCLDTHALLGPKWTDFSFCSAQLTNKKVLVVVHGMMSCVEAMSIPYPKLSSNYDLIVGFDYDWTQHLTDSGTLLAAFIEKLSQLGATQIDILSHSEGVPVSLYAAAEAPDRVKIKNFVGLAGPILGTPVAASPDTLLKILLHLQYSLSFNPSTFCPVAPQLNLISIAQQPFQQDLVKNSDTLTKIILPAVKTNLPGRNFLLAGGENPTKLFLFNLNFIDGDPFIGAPNDGIVGLDSALGYNSGIQVRPLPPFQSLFHSDLPGSDSVISEMANQISAANSEFLPILNCQGSSATCAGPQDSSFIFSGSSFDPGAASVTLFRQDSTGTVTAVPSAGAQLSNGSYSFAMAPCVDPPGLLSLFAFDGKLASNNVMQTVTVGSCTAMPPDTITTIAGTSVPGYSGDQGLATAAQLNGPAGLAFDTAGNLFIADTANNVVRRVDAVTGIITTVAGTGVAGFSGDGGAAINAELNKPVDLTTDRAGNIYVSDVSNARVRKINVDTGIISTFAGNGINGFSGDGGPATDAALSFPNGIKFDPAGNLFFADSLNNRIRRIDGITGVITTVAGTGVSGFSGDGGPATNATFGFPSDVRIDTAGNIYIADFQNNRIRKVDTSGTINTIAGNGTSISSGDNGPATNAGIAGPLAITTDSAGNLYIGAVSEQHIRLVNTGTTQTTVAGITVQPGQIVTMAGIGTAGYSGDGGLATSAQINNPSGFALDAAGNLVFTDSGNSVVRQITSK